MEDLTRAIDTLIRRACTNGACAPDATRIGPVRTTDTGWTADLSDGLGVDAWIVTPGDYGFGAGVEYGTTHLYGEI